MTAEQRNLDAVIAKVLTALRSKFNCHEDSTTEDDRGIGFIFTDPADGVSYELRVREFDLREWR